MFLFLLVSFVLFCLLLLLKYTKKLVPFQVIVMASYVLIPLSPEEVIFTFKQGDKESFREAWSRISESYDKTEPKMTLSLLLSSFYFGLVLCYRYALDTMVGGDFLRSDEDKSLSAVKKLLLNSISTSMTNSDLLSIHNRLNTLETSVSCLKLSIGHIHEHYDYVPINLEPSGWVPIVKVGINGGTFDARCDIMS